MLCRLLPPLLLAVLLTAAAVAEQPVQQQQQPPVQQQQQQPPPVQQQQQQPPPVQQQQQQQPPVRQQQQQQPPPVQQQQQQPPVQQQQQQPPVQQQQQQQPPVQQQQQQPPVQQQQQQQPPVQQQQQPPVQQQQQQQQQPPVQQQQHQQPPVQQQQQQQQPPPVQQQPPEHHEPPSEHDQPFPEHHESPSEHHEPPSEHDQPPPEHQQPGHSEEAMAAVPQKQKRIPSVLLPSEVSEFDTRSISFVFLLPSRGKQCFYHRALSNFTFEYQVTNGGSLDVDVFVNSPGGKLAFDRRGKAYGEATFPADRSEQQRLPAYMLCLDNRYSSWHDKLLYFSIEVEQDREGRRDAGEKLSDASKANLKQMEVSWEEFYKSTDKVEDHLLRTIYHQSKSRNNEARDRMLMEASYYRVNAWSLFQLLVMLSVAGIQVLMIRSLFDDKSKLHRMWKSKS